MSRCASHTGLSPSMMFLSKNFCSHAEVQCRGPTTPHVPLPRSLATTRGIISLFSLPPGTKMFQFPGLALLLGKSDSPSD